MTWTAVRVRTFLGWIVCVLLAGMFVPMAHADGLALTASFGIAGRYRAGGWCPVMVTVRNPGGESIAGQVQVLSADTPAQSPNGRFRPSSQLAPSVLFARPVSLLGGAAAQTFQVDVRGLDPSTSEVTVQLVEGRKRGDGRVRARISTQDPNTSAAITGTPVAGIEPLIVSFGSDPGAFPPLRGLKLNAALPQTVQVAGVVTATELPDRAAGYGGVTAVLLGSDAPVEALTEAQSDALRGWLACGGHLIVCGGPDTTRLLSSFYSGLLPRAWTKHTAATVSGSYGAGRVTLTGAEQAANWKALLRDNTSSSLLTHAAAREENYTPNYYGGRENVLLSQAVMRGPALDAPGTGVIGVFLLVYLLVLVPANYLILKRLDRKELAWVTIPALVLVFALGTFAVGYAAKGGALFINRAAIIETTAGRREAGIYSEVGVFSPRRTSYDLAIPGANVLAALPNPGTGYGYSNNRSEGQSYGQTHFVQTSDGDVLPDMAYNMWSMRAFDVQSTLDLGGAITARFVGPAGTITNHTPHTLTHCAVLWNGDWQPLGDLASKASLSVTLPTGKRLRGQAGLPPPPGSQSSDPNDAKADIHARMQAALADYVRSLGQPTNNYSGSPSPPPYAPSPHEALFVGWSRDPSLAGPPPRVDGHTVPQNAMSLVIVHVPLSGPMAAPNAGDGP